MATVLYKFFFSAKSSDFVLVNFGVRRRIGKNWLRSAMTISSCTFGVQLVWKWTSLKIVHAVDGSYAIRFSVPDREKLHALCLI